MPSPFSSSSEIDDSAIDAVIAEVTDLCALEQIAELNTAHLSDSHLPSNLDTRFERLKSFPAAKHEWTNEEKENVPGSLNRSESSPIPWQDPKPDQRPVKPDIREEKQRSGGSPSPPRKSCCFVFPPKRIQRRGSKIDGDDDDDDEIMKEFGSRKLKERRRKLKKAWKDQEKANEEAEKMATWVKQVSSKINEAAIDELLKEELK
ncbi:uncharacterized protein A4U43_C08F510 [Asparagus officinalis]|uniref:uncharacterized protein LOC109822926 n=1 Tax=Asparagus officinalis TaxID=4686 RepID=UPI00098E3892|nr:uncharacterized protein LOC109822926 [Asparagus officinalis]ONK58863.1 uncharacterized protein A4U43_C08F510 [Asparagus officinalis]